jgi:hypothetical protein
MFIALVVLCPAQSPAEKTDMDGYWWANMTPSFKLGWVSGYAKAMDLAGTLQMSTCAANLPMYSKEFPNIDPKDVLQKMCLSDTTFDYDSIPMGQFVDGMDTFYKDYRNKQLEVGGAIEYVRDEIKGKPARELEAKVTLWRGCTAADKSHPMPRNSDDAAQVAKACTPDVSVK